jgi:hypothetical protein
VPGRKKVLNKRRHRKNFTVTFLTLRYKKVASKIFPCAGRYVSKESQFHTG